MISNNMEGTPDPFQNLYQTIQTLLPLDEADQKILEQAFTVKEVPAKTVLNAGGTVADELYFVHTGLLRLYYTTRDNAEVTAFLFSENMFAAALESFLSQQPGIQTLETFEPCTLLVLSRENLGKLYADFPKSHIIMRKVMEQRFIHAQQVVSSHILLTPGERYVQFAEKFPDLMQRVPQHVLASFLGITPVSLSRIRKRIVGR